MSHRAEQIQALKEKVIKVKRELLLAELELFMLRREELGCSCRCVRLNKDIDIYNHSQQVNKNRVGLELGIPGEIYSADKYCIYCHGTGKLK